MLLRSASTPLMKSWSHHSHLHELSVSATTPKQSTLSPNQKNRALSETDLRVLSSSNLKSTPTAHTFLEDIESEDSFDEVATCPCFGGSGSDQGGGNDSNNNNDDENGEMDEYYKNAIKGNPENCLILGNYARFLKEVKGDVEGAMEYCERAIVAKSDDGYVLAMYGELIWEMERDGGRAETYFDRAVKSAPENCYVLASYARFMWDVEDEVDEEEEHEDVGHNGVEESGVMVCGIEKAKFSNKNVVMERGG